MVQALALADLGKAIVVDVAMGGLGAAAIDREAFAPATAAPSDPTPVGSTAPVPPPPGAGYAHKLSLLLLVAPVWVYLPWQCLFE